MNAQTLQINSHKILVDYIGILSFVFGLKFFNKELSYICHALIHVGHLSRHRTGPTVAKINKFLKEKKIKCFGKIDFYKVCFVSSTI